MIYEFAATQDLHGYDAPWPAGGGVNLLPPCVAGTYTSTDGNCKAVVDDNGLITLSGTAGASSTTLFIPLSESCISPATSYYLHILNSDAMGSVSINLEKDTDVANTNINLSMSTANRIGQKTRTSVEWNQVRFWIASGQTPSGTVHPMICMDGTAQSFTPYSNICPPEGFNIWDPENQDYAQIYAGYVNSNTRELYLRPVYPEYDGEELVGPWMSSLDPYDEDSTPTVGAFVIDFGGELTSFEITPYMLQTLLDSLGIRQHFLNGASLLNSLMDQAQGRVRSEDELLNRSMPLKVIAIGDQLPSGLKFKPITKDVLPGLPGNLIR